MSVFQILATDGGLGCGGEDFYCVVFSSYWLPFHSMPSLRHYRYKLQFGFLSEVIIQYFIDVEAVKLSGNLHQFQTLPFQLKHIKCCNILEPVVLYGCGTWSLTVRKENKLTIFDSRVLRTFFVSERGVVMED